MENNVLKKEYDPSLYERATLEEYGYKDHKVLKMTWKITSIILLVLSVFMLYFSIIIIAIQSFNSSASTTKFESFTFANYIHMFDKPILNKAIMNTFQTSIIATLIATVLGTLIGIGAYYMNPKIKSRLILLNNIPLLNADIVTGISIMIILQVIQLIPGFKHMFGFPTLLIAHVYFILPYVILNVLPKMREIDPNMLDASLDLGLKPIKAIRKVLIPAIKGGIFSGMVLAFTISFEDFVVGYFTTGNGFNTLSIWLYTNLKKELFPGVYAFSTAVTIIMIVLVLLFGILKGRIENGKKKNS